MTIIQRLNIFIKEVLVEMKRVSWLSRRAVINYTLLVLLVTVVVAFFLGGLDYIFTAIIKSLIIR